MLNTPSDKKNDSIEKTCNDNLLGTYQRLNTLMPLMNIPQTAIVCEQHTFGKIKIQLTVFYSTYILATG